MLGKPRILSLFPNSFNKFNKHEHSCKILYLNVDGKTESRKDGQAENSIPA